MAINLSEMNLEKKKLKEINNLIELLIKSTQEDNEKFESKISELRKQARGKYSYEFENIEQLYGIINNKLKNYISIKDKPYFARIDFKEKLRDKETLYIGKIGIPNEIYEYMRSEIIDNFEKNIIDSDDLAPMLYLKFKINGLDDDYIYKHIVIDEAQDYSIFQFYVIKSMSKGNSFTIVGDIGQGIYYYKGINDWNKLSKQVYTTHPKYISLSQSYRSTVEIVNFANKVLQKQYNNIKLAKPVLRHGDNPQIIKFNSEVDFAEKLDKIVKKLNKQGRKNIAVIGKTLQECTYTHSVLKKYSTNKWNIIKSNNKSISFNNIVIPSYMTKGLEFDCSVIYNCSQQNYSESAIDKKLLYVVLTRALHKEYIFYKGEISRLIK